MASNLFLFTRSIGQGLKKALGNFRNIGNASKRIERNKNEPLSEEDKKRGKGLLGRVEVDHGKKPTKAEIDKDFFQEIVTKYNVNFRNTVGDGLPFQAYLKRMDQELQDQFWASLGVDVESMTLSQYDV